MEEKIIEEKSSQESGSEKDELIGPGSFLKRTLRYILKMRIEPGLLFYMVASSMGNIIAADLQLDRACRVNLGFNDTVCDVLAKSPKPPTYKPFEDEVQDVVSSISVWSEVIDNLFPILFSIFLGSWSDIYGQKLPFLLGIGGVLARYGGLFAATYFAAWGAEAIALISTVPSSLTGGRIAISMVMYSYITVTTSVKERTTRVGIATAVRLFGRSAGSTLSGYLKRGGHSHRTIFGIGIGFGLLAFVYVLLFLSNPKHLPGVKEKRGAQKAFGDIFSLERIIEALKSFLKPRPCGIRVQLYLLVIILIFTMAPMQGEDTVLLLFVRKHLEWDVAKYAYYGTFRMLTAFGGGIISVLILVKWFKLSDWLIGIMACFSQIAGSLIYAFATEDTEYMMYIAPVVDILNGTMIIASRAMISKIIPKDEMGRVNAVVSVIDSTTPLWGNPMYSKVYNVTLQTFAGTFFLVSAALTVPPLGLFLFFGVSKKGTPFEEQIAKKDAKPFKQ